VNESPPVSIVVIADDPLVRAGLASSLDDGEVFDVLAQFPLSGLEANDLEMPGADIFIVDEGWGDEGIRDDHLLLPEEVPILRLVDPSLLEKTAKIPTHSLISRETALDPLKSAIQAVAAGWIILDPLVSAYQHDVTEQDYAALTDREHEVLELVAEGMTNRAISTRLEISENTVKFHINSIFNKLSVQSRTEAVVLAVRIGLLPL
jgi:DNA-binding NarL/FixJ family response regulator